MPNIGKSEVMEIFKGINNVLPPDKSLDGYLKELVNLDIDKDNNLSKRKGYVLKDTANYHSLWSDGLYMFAVRNGDLVSIKPDSSFKTLVSSIGDSKISFDTIDGVYYYTSKFRSGKIENNIESEWGISIPNPLPTLTEVTDGTLLKGFYQIGITYVTSLGEESGLSVASVIEISDNSGITLTGIPTSTNSKVSHINIYSTLQNGDDFNRVAQITNGTTSYTLTDVSFSDKPLETFGIYPPPNGTIVKWAHGRLFIVQDNILWFSEPFQYDHFKVASSYMYFNEKITAICPTPGGIWISSDKIYYASGKDPTEMRLSEKELAKVVPGSEVKFSGAYIFIENTPLGYKWLVTTNRGMFVLFNDGVILSITEQNVSMPKAIDAASGFIQEDGINRYVSLLREKEKSQNTAIGDLVTSTIVRNGITIT